MVLVRQCATGADDDCDAENEWKLLGAVHIFRQPPEGGGGVSQKLTIADKGGGGLKKFKKDIFCEQKCG